MQRAASVESDVPCPESATSPASGGWFGMRPSGADRAGLPRKARWFEVAAKNRCGVLCHENTTSLLSVFGPGSWQHVRLQTSNAAESRGRKVVSAEALPCRQTAGGSCRGKDGERAALDPNGSGHAVVQPRAAGNHWKVVGSSVGSLDEDEWRCHGRWFLRCCEDNGIRRRFVSPWGAIARSCRSLRRWAGGRDMHEKSPRIR